MGGRAVAHSFCFDVILKPLPLPADLRTALAARHLLVRSLTLVTALMKRLKELFVKLY